jgi:hypothetical protein
MALVEDKRLVQVLAVLTSASLVITAILGYWLRRDWTGEVCREHYVMLTAIG